MMKKSDRYLNITSPENSLAGLMVEKVSLPGQGGRFTVLSGHAPIISSLVEGDVEYVVGGKPSSLHIRSGFVEVSDNTVSVCAEL